MPATGYIIEHDKSGRASWCAPVRCDKSFDTPPHTDSPCLHRTFRCARSKGACKQKIEKGALRFGSCSTAAWDGEQTHFRKLTCMTKKVAQNALDFYGGDITQLRNWATLSADEQAEVCESLAGAAAASSSSARRCCYLPLAALLTSRPRPRRRSRRSSTASSRAPSRRRRRQPRRRRRTTTRRTLRRPRRSRRRRPRRRLRPLLPCLAMTTDDDASTEPPALLRGMSARGSVACDTGAAALHAWS